MTFLAKVMKGGADSLKKVLKLLSEVEILKFLQSKIRRYNKCQVL